MDWLLPVGLTPICRQQPEDDGRSDADYQEEGTKEQGHQTGSCSQEQVGGYQSGALIARS
jgi:hypothetical protein